MIFIEWFAASNMLVLVLGSVKIPPVLPLGLLRFYIWSFEFFQCLPATGVFQQLLQSIGGD